jgi:hypothetical protein
MHLKEMLPGFSACKSFLLLCKYRIDMRSSYDSKADGVYSQWEKEGNVCCCAESA